jgi:sugar phosphate isomerase/epimerase
MALVLAAGSMLDQTPIAMIDAAAAAGFDAVGLRLAGPGAHADTDAVIVQRHARQRMIAIHDAEVYRIGSHDDPAVLIERAARAGATKILVVSDTMVRSDTIAGVVSLVDLAGASGITVALEYMAWTDPSNPLDAVAIAKETGCLVVVDLLHHVRVGATADDLRMIIESGTLGWVQLCDAAATCPGDLLHEARHQRLVPGTGALALTELLAAVGPDVTVSVEVQNDELLAVEPTRRARLLHDAARAVLAGR